jgi:DNA-binding MarR family transcriptional regulator
MRNRNKRTGRKRIPWAVLDDRARKERFRQARQALANGLRGSPIISFEEFEQRQLALDKLQVPYAKRHARKIRAMPPFFDTPERTAIIATLYINGPMTVRELSRLREVDSGSTYRTIERLIRCGLIVKRGSPGGRKYVAINRAHACISELRKLLTVLANKYGVPISDQPRYRHGFPLDRDPAPPVAENQMFGSPVRSRLLVILALLDEADDTQLSRLLAANACSVDYATKSLETKKVLKSRKLGVRRMFSLRTGYAGAPEFRLFLLSVSKEVPVYQVLASLVNEVTMRLR